MNTSLHNLYVSDSDVLELMPLSVQKEHGSWIFGVPGRRRYYAISEDGARAIRLLASKLSIGEVRRALQVQLGASEVELGPLLQALIAAGAVRSVAGRSLDSTDPAKESSIECILGLRCFHFLFSRPAVRVYLLWVTIAAILLFWRGWPFLSLAVLLQGASSGSALACLLIAGAGVLRHEWAHGIACQWLGITPRFRLSTRFFFPVVETDMTDLWSISPRRRWIAYIAGMACDLLTLCLLVIAAVGLRLGHGTHPFLLWLLSLCAVTTVGQLLWECNAYLRTDLYYVIAWAMGCRRLHYDAARFLLSLLPLARCKGRATKHPLAVRCYAWYMLAGYSASVFFVAAIVLAASKTLVIAATGKPLPSAAPEGAYSALGLLAFNLLFTLAIKLRGSRSASAWTVVETGIGVNP